MLATIHGSGDIRVLQYTYASLVTSQSLQLCYFCGPNLALLALKVKLVRGVAGNCVHPSQLFKQITHSHASN